MQNELWACGICEHETVRISRDVRRAIERLPIDAATLRPASDAGGHICPRCDAYALGCDQAREKQPVLTMRSGKTVRVEDLTDGPWRD